MGGGWRKFCNEGRHVVFLALCFMIIKSRRMRLAGLVACIEKKRTAYRI
jgi:hypothetical protein